jgi:hypothetical protein
MPGKRNSQRAPGTYRLFSHSCLFSPYPAFTPIPIPVIVREFFQNVAPETGLSLSGMPRVPRRLVPSRGPSTALDDTSDLT